MFYRLISSYYIFHMFKQRSYQQGNDDQYLRRDKKSYSNRIVGLGIKVTSNWQDSNKNSANKKPSKSPPKVQPPSEQLARGQSSRGIKVISSRQSSNERPIPTSHSQQYRKQQRPIKSQTNISQFDSATQTKQASIEKRSPGGINEQTIYEDYQQRFKQAMKKQHKFYQSQMEELKQIIASNEDRINNLIKSLNSLAESGEKKSRHIERLQSKINANIKYSQQCYQYTLSRCSDSQIMLRLLKEEIEKTTVKDIRLQNKMDYIERITADIFMMQRSFSYYQQQIFDTEFNVYEGRLQNIRNKLQSIQNNETSDLQQIKKNMNSQLLSLKQQVKTLKYQANNSQYSWINKEQLSINLQNMKFKISQLEQVKNELAQEMKVKQQKSQLAIWELSSLLNKRQRELQTVQSQNSELLRYNKEIQDKLIESRSRQNSFKLYIENNLKILEASKNDETLRVSQQNQVFRQKYEEIFRHSQYLENINCKNQLELLNNSKIISKLQKQIQDAKQTINNIQLNKLEQIRQLKQYYQGNEQNLNYRILCLEKDISISQQEIDSLKQQIKVLEQQQSEKILRQKQMKEYQKYLIDEKDKVVVQYNKICSELKVIQKELDQEEQYSQHLQRQNEKLQAKLIQYSSTFQQQTNMFKATIDKLKKQKYDLLNTLQAGKTDRTTTSNPSKPQQKQIIESSRQKLQKLQKAITLQGYKTPVPCEIDGTGYLKHLEKGTYIIDDEQNLFDLNLEEKHLAIKANLIHLFQ